MSTLTYPLELRFKHIAIASQIAVRDGAGSLICYVKQKAFKLKEDVTIYADEAQTNPLYRIAADRVIDISAQYRIEDAQGRPVGVLRRLGMRSFWRAQYEVQRDGRLVFHMREENPWIKVADALLGEIPIIGIFVGYALHPAYRVARADTGEAVLRIVKRPAFLEGKFRVEPLASQTDDDERLALMSILMMLLLERRRG